MVYKFNETLLHKKVYIVIIVIKLIREYATKMPKSITIIPKATMARILQNSGAKRVSEEAADALTEAMIGIAKGIAEQAVKISRHAGRKTVHEEDINMAVKQ